MTIEAASVTIDAPNAIRLASSSRSEGVARTPMTPMSGMTPRTLTHGNPCVMSASPGPYDEQRGGHQQRAGQHGQGIGAGEAGLGPPGSRGGAPNQRGEP